jgi:hypothetical protein
MNSKRRKTWFYIIGSLVVLLVAFRLALPYILLRFVNREIDMMEGYDGYVKDIDVSLIRGAYAMKDIRLDKDSYKIPVPFFAADVIDLSIEWEALFKGELVGEIIVDNPEMNFVKGPTEATSQTGIDKSWVDVVDELMPLSLNRFEVFNGKVFYRDFHSSPKVDVGATDLHILATNLTNADDLDKELPSDVDATGNMYGGKLKFDMQIDPLRKLPQFDAKAELTGMDLKKVNDFIKAYGNFDVSKGEFSVYAEAAANEGRITGYTKPIVKDIKVLNWNEDKEKGKPLQPVWEAIVGGTAWLFKNKSKDQVATKAEFTGNIKDPDFDTWGIIGQILRNAFIEALFPSLENSVSLSSLNKKEEKKGFFKKLFGDDDKKKER